MEVRYEAPAVLREIFRQNKPTDDCFLIAFQKWPLQTMFIQVTYIGTFKMFVARPVTPNPDGDLEIANVTIPDEWYHYLKHSLKRHFCIRRVIDINNIDNEERVGDLLGVKQI